MGRSDEAERKGSTKWPTREGQAEGADPIVMKRKGPIREDRMEGVDPNETERRGPIRGDRLEGANRTRRSG